MVPFSGSVKAYPDTLSVPSDDYPTIQDAVNAASPGDVILVASETYYENLVINTSLTLTGAGESTTFIHGDPKEAGIEIIVDNVNISGFTILNCENGINMSSNGNTIIDNTITSNILYGIYVEFSDDNKIMGNTIVSNDFGIYLRASSKNHVNDNKIGNNNYTGIYIESQSNSNFINNNTITTNRFYGVTLDNSANNIIRNNQISNNDAGIGLSEGSSGNVISGNTISNNTIYGFDIFQSSDNTFYQNNIVNNKVQVTLDAATNTWDNGAEGNYWSDYNGTDSNGDGIGETSYQGIDNYPLIDPWSFFRVFNITTDGETHVVTTFSNSTIASFNFNQTLQQISFNVTGPSGTLGFCDVTIPRNLLESEPPSVWAVTIDGINSTFSPTENSTHTTLQFTYGQATRGVQIRVIEPQNVPPTADYTYSPINPTIYDTVDFVDTSHDLDGQIVSWHWEFGDGNESFIQNPRYRHASAGEYVVTLTVVDNRSAATMTSKVVTVREVRTTLTLDGPSKVIEGELFTITATLRDEYENPLPQALIDFYLSNLEGWENIASAETNSSGMVSITHTSPQVAGIRRLKATFLGTQIFAESSSAYTIEIAKIPDVALPEADAGSDRSVHVRTPVIFNASGSSDNVGVVSYEWDFGDGATGTGVTVTHTYAEPGTYTVTLTVRDAAENSDTDTIIVTVKEDSSFFMWIASVILVVGIITAIGLLLWKRKKADK